MPAVFSTRTLGETAGELMTYTTAEYLVRAREPFTLAPVIAFFEAEPLNPIQRRLGPAGAPHTLVVSLTDVQAAALKERFAGRLIVERDEPLTPYRA
jgi:hypothetical protein